MLLGPAILTGRKWQEATARMEYGTRSIRSAGQGSGSVEVTLPPAFRGLAGLPCRVALRDGLRPELVLQPDLAAARAAFGRLWALLAEAMGIEPSAPLPLAECALTLWPAAEAGVGVPRLAWADGIAIAGAAPHPASAVARSVAALAMLAARRRGVAPALVEDFGAAAGHALAGVTLHPARQAACDIAAALLAGSGFEPDAALALAAEDAGSAAFRAAALPRLQRLLDQHLEWTDDPARHAAMVAAWRRGVALELSGA